VEVLTSSCAGILFGSLRSSRSVIVERVILKEKAATPSKPPEIIERKGASQLDSGEKARPVAAKVPEASREIKGGKQTVAERKESKGEKQAVKTVLEGKAKSDETKEEKIEGKP